MLQVAWKFIKFDKAKSIGVIVGILISTFLIGQQLGILIFLTNAMQALATNVKADIWVVDNKTKDVNQLGKLDIRTLRSVQSFPGIQQAFPVLITGASCNFQNGTSAAITIIGVDMTQLKYILDSNKIIAGKTEDLQMDGAISGEFFEKKNLGDNLDLGTEFEINGKRAYFALQTKGFRGFGSSFCITTIERARYYANTSKTSISAVLVKLSPGANPDTIASEISTGLFGVTAWPSKKLGYSTVKKILSSSGIALSTGTLIIFALVSGFFIIGLTMYSSALDRLKDYGILKAIGAGNKYIRKLILLQAMLLLEGFRKGVAHSGLVFQFSTSLIFLILMTIVLISIGGASFALRRISSVEPAAVFR
jgi:putative ABC transport system permease protein